MEVQPQSNQPAPAAVGTAPRPCAASFWRRQIAGPPTRAQVVFDVIFGVLLPIACVLLDPVVFRGGSFRPPILQGHQAFAWPFIGLEALALAVWLAFVRGRWGAFFGGLFLPAALFSIGVGIAILPFSAIGIAFAGIGLLGLSPLVSAFVFARNGLQAIVRSGASGIRGSRMFAACLGAALAVLLPAAFELFVHHRTSMAVDAIVAGRPEKQDMALKDLRRFGWGTAAGDVMRLAKAYREIESEGQREMIARAYTAMTGLGIIEIVD